MEKLAVLSDSAVECPSLDGKKEDSFADLKSEISSTDTENEKKRIAAYRTCEAEVCFQDEADLHRHLNSCKKNPGHHEFIPVDQFSMEHLPPGYKESDLLDLIRAMSNLTVRLSVKYVSKRRPKTWFRSDDPYPCYSDCPKTILRTGTGWVCWVDKNSPYSSPEKPCAEICIKTATHVVFDDLEAQRTTCDLFFDRGTRPNVCPGVVTLTRVSVTETNKIKDWCEMSHLTYDLDLADKLEKMIRDYRSLEEKVSSWYRGCLETYTRKRSSASDSVPEPKKPLIVIVSHPHGCSKQVSVGYCASRIYQGYYSQLTYSTPTCPGSSGAHILYLGNGQSDHQHFHAGTCKRDGKLNQSSTGLDSFYSNFIDLLIYRSGTTVYNFFPALQNCRLCTEDVLVKSMLLQMPEFGRQGPWEVLVSYGEVELQQNYDTCEKNPGHLKFTPVDQFKLEDIPSDFRYTEVLDLIVAISNLTVRLSVKYISKKRPVSWPGGETHDQSCSSSTRNMMITGTGYVTKVMKYKNDDEYKMCSCKECQVSPTPKTEFAHVYVRTSAQVLCDEFEGEHSSCDFFFDRGSAPDTCGGGITLSGASRVDCSERDTREVIYETHDLNLADKLTEMRNKCESVEDVCKNKYLLKHYFVHEFRNPEEDLAVIVSHPHGCSKQVSIGFCVTGRTENFVFPEMSYTTSTCPGSAGARVFVLSRSRKFQTLVHVGKCEINEAVSHCVRSKIRASFEENKEI